MAASAAKRRALLKRLRRPRPGRRGPAPNPLRADPSKTGVLRRRFAAELKRRFSRLKRELVLLAQVEDAFGLGAEGPPAFAALVANAFCPTGEGGGVDPSCSPEGGGSGGRASVKVSLPKTAKEAGQAMADALAHVKPDVAADPALREKVAKNWARELRGRVIGSGPEYDALKAGMEDNLSNKDFAEVVAKRGPQAVVLVKSDGTSKRAEKVGATTLVHSVAYEPVRRNDQPPTPGMATSEDAGGIAAVLRHEYAHRVLDHLPAAEQSRWREAAAKIYPESEPLKKELTIYAGRSMNRDEWFTEAFAVGTSPGYDPSRFAPRARHLIAVTIASAKGEAHPTANKFCATGEGGKVDPSCGKADTGSGGGAKAGGTGGKSFTTAVPTPAQAAATAFKATLAALGSLGAKAAHLEHVGSSYVKDRITESVSRLPPKVAAAVHTSWAVGKVGTAALFANWTAAQALAERVSREKGSTPEQARRLRGVLSSLDMKTFEALKVGSLTGAHFLHGPMAAAAIFPPATTSYLAYNTARHPMATFHAATGLVRDAAGSVAGGAAAAGRKVASLFPSRGPRPSLPQRRQARPGVEELTRNRSANDRVRKLADELAKHQYDDWYVALLSAALTETGSLEEALKVAGKAHETTPKNPTDAGPAPAVNAKELTGGRWVTIEGVHVYIKGGRIEAGPKELVGKKPDELPRRGGGEGDGRSPADLSTLVHDDAHEHEKRFRADLEKRYGPEVAARAAELRLSWRQNLFGPQARALERHAAEHLKVAYDPQKAGPLHKMADDYLPKVSLTAAEKTAFAAVVAETQHQLRDAEVKEVTVYRGTHLPAGYTPGAEASVENRALSSWSTSREAAAPYGRVVSATVPASQVVMVFGGRDTEVVLSGRVKGTVLNTRAAGKEVGAPTANVGRWAVQAPDQQAQAFQSWLRATTARLITSPEDKALWDEYARAGFKQGSGRAFDEVGKGRMGAAARVPAQLRSTFVGGAKDQFLREVFSRPKSADRVRLISAAAFADYEGVTGAMAVRMGRVVADGLLQGWTPHRLARELTQVADLALSRALQIARDEVVRSASEGTLDAMERLGVGEVTAAVEWTTSGLPTVCPRCAALEGVVLTVEEARGLLPLHPFCNCSWLPAVTKEEGQVRKARAIRGAFDEADVDRAVAGRRPRPLGNIFCPTGEGGGVDPSCSPGEKSGGAKPPPSLEELKARSLAAKPARVAAFEGTERVNLPIKDSWSDHGTFMAEVRAGRVPDGIHITPPYVSEVVGGKASVRADLHSDWNGKENREVITRKPAPPAELTARTYYHGTDRPVASAADLRPGKQFGNFGENEYKAVYLTQNPREGYDWGSNVLGATLAPGTRIAVHPRDVRAAAEKHRGKYPQDALVAEGYHAVAKLDQRGDVTELIVFDPKVLKPTPTTNYNPAAEFSRAWREVANAFCPTGPGGGQDNSCGKGSGAKTPRRTFWVPDPYGNLTQVTENPDVAGVLNWLQTLERERQVGGLRGLVRRGVAYVWEGNTLLSHDLFARSQWGPGSEVPFGARFGVRLRSGKMVVESYAGAGADEEVRRWARGSGFPVANAFCPTGPGGGIDPKCGKGEGVGAWSFLANAFCRTGKGGGQDNSCSAAEGGASSTAAERSARPVASAAEMRAALLQARRKIVTAPVPSAEAVLKARAELERAKAGEGRAGGDSRGGSSADRRKQRENLFEEFGGKERGYVVCHNCGTKCHHLEPGKGGNTAGYKRFERGKIFTKRQGGGYQLPNLLPECFDCNRSRNDTPIRKENLT